MQVFAYTSNPARVVFGAGSLQYLGREIDALGACKVLVLCTPGNARWLNVWQPCWQSAAPACLTALQCTYQLRPPGRRER